MEFIPKVLKIIAGSGCLIRSIIGIKIPTPIISIEKDRKEKKLTLNI
jgi:hypothetical protein